MGLSRTDMSKETNNLIESKTTPSSTAEDSFALPAFGQNVQLYGHPVSSNILQIDNGQESKSGVVFVDSKNVNNLLIKAESTKDFEIENNLFEISKNCYVSSIKLEPEEIEQKESPEVVEHSNSDHSHCKGSDTVASIKQELEEIVPQENFKLFDGGMLLDAAPYKSDDFVIQELNILSKTENSETKSENDKWPEDIYDWNIKDEEVDLKEEDSLENQDVDLKKEDLLENGINESSESLDNDKEHKCHVCGYQTKCKSMLKRHALLHENPIEVGLLKCNLCKYQTHQKAYFKKHALLHKNPEEVRLFKCDKCEFQTRYNCSLKTHALRHRNTEDLILFKCDKCKFQTCYKHHFKKHYLRHKNPEEVDLFKCDKCEYQTLDKGNFNKHSLRHKNPEEVHLFKCGKCEFQTRHRNSLGKHALRHKNPEELIYLKCDKCEHRTRYKSAFKQHALRHKISEEVNLSKHLLRNKNPGKFFKCDNCEYRSRSKWELKQHVSRHKNPEYKLFRCDEKL